MNKFSIGDTVINSNTTRDNRAFIVDSNKIYQFLAEKNNTSQDAIDRFEKRKKGNTDKA